MWRPGRRQVTCVDESSRRRNTRREKQARKGNIGRKWEKTMLKITEHRDGQALTFKLAGKLAGEWTPELERCWRYTIAARQPASVNLDLSEVTFVDDAGKQLLL